MPASAHSRATSAAWTSEPPASTSSRSRQASTWMRWRPARGGEVADLGDWGRWRRGTASLTGDRPPHPQFRPGETGRVVRWPIVGAGPPAFASGTGSAVCYGLPRLRTNACGSCARLDGATVSSSDAVARPTSPRRSTGSRAGSAPSRSAGCGRRAPPRCRPAGRIVEIGSFRGRSMIVLARAAPEGVEIVAIDPHAGNDRGPQEIDGFEDEAAERPRGVPHATSSGPASRDRVRHVRKFCDDAHDDVDGADRPALHRRRPPLRPGPRRHPRRGATGSAAAARC